MSNGRDYSYENGQPYRQPQPNYHDSPPRNIISPPPQYASPPPQTHSRGWEQERELQRRPQPGPYSDHPSPPLPPSHREQPGLASIDTYSSHGYRPTSVVTPGMDNFSNTAYGGGMHGLAQGVADRNERESGIEALRSAQGAPAQNTHYTGYDRDYQRNAMPPSSSGHMQNHDRAFYATGLPIGAGASTPGSVTPDFHSSRHSAHDIPLDHYPPHPNDNRMSYYHDSPYHAQSAGYSAATISQASVNPNEIVDDGDDGFMPEPQRRSFMPGKQRSADRLGGSAAAAGGAAALGGVFGRKAAPNTSYNLVSAHDGPNSSAEKSAWLSKQKKGGSKLRWIVGGIIVVVIILAIVGGVVGGILGSRSSKNNSGSGGSASAASSTWNTASGDLAANGDLDKNSPEIKALLNDKNLHRVFPAMDYTPWGCQYPLCEKYPPSPNNVTRDVAVMSQLTNTIRLYGIDCNQTEMVLHSFKQLGLTDMKLWLGVWIDTNQTTNDRQMKHMYQLLKDQEDLSIFKGVIIGNEALFRAGESKADSQQELADFLDEARAEFKTNGWDLPIATSDLGDNWTGALVSHVDFVMANIHPFFAGVTVEEAAGWTWSFWQNHNVPLTAGTNKGQIISETGWPSGGGTDCGGETGDCAPGQSGSVASVDNMNVFMEDWVCQAMDNGTDYFWFSAFDEPWKVSFNEPGKEWEDKWGLMDPARNLKDGLKIPDCGGKTIEGIDWSKSGQTKR